MPRHPNKLAALTPVLSAPQETALLALAEGATQGEAAERAGVTRETVSRWRRDDPEFTAALNGVRKDIWDASVDRLRLLALKSTEVLAKLLESDDPRMRLAAAQTALKAAGLEALAAPSALTDAEDIALEQQKAAQQRRMVDMLTNL
jgi:transcriptional regulator with XRE-family HTH domain